MKMDKKNWPLYLAFAAPLIMIALVVAVTGLPGLFNKPTYNFIYAASSGGYYSGNRYDIDSNGNVIEIPPPANVGAPAPVDQAIPRLYYYNVKTDISTQLTLAQANTYLLSTNSTSPDGYTIGYGNRADGLFPFFIDSSTDYSTRYIQGHGVNRKIKLNNDIYYYYNNFQFIGWVTGSK